jgi:two-component system nitrate/nitrite response regulator NarL
VSSPRWLSGNVAMPEAFRESDPMSAPPAGILAPRSRGIHLPASWSAAPAEVAASRDAPRHHDRHDSTVGVRCLIVDDNEVFVASARRLLEAQGLEVLGAASSGPEALRLSSELGANVVLVDVELDGESGFDVARQLAGAEPPVKVLLISMYRDDELADLIADSPAVGFLPKSRLSAVRILELLG